MNQRMRGAPAASCRACNWLRPSYLACTGNLHHGVLKIATLKFLAPPFIIWQVNHWSRREQEGFPVLAGADFSTIAPPLPEARLGAWRLQNGCSRKALCSMSDVGQIWLPGSVLLQLPLTPLPLLLHPCHRAPSLQGWQWCEEKWHLDLSPQIIDACDAEGWSYGERWWWAWVQSKLPSPMMR